MNTDETEIRSVIGRWSEATRRGDLAAVLALMTDDAIFLTPGREPMDREAFAAAFPSAAALRSMEIAQEIREIRTSGSLAYCWSYIRVSLKPVAGGEPSRRSGHVLTVFRKSDGGEWRLFRDANLLT